MSYSGETEKRQFIRDLDREDQIFIESISDKIKDKYNEQVSFFKDNILCAGLDSIIRDNEFSCTKTGLILDGGPPDRIKNDRYKFSFIALEPEPLEKLQTFFQSLDKIADHAVYPVFSPEEEVLEPYFYFLGLDLEILFENSKIRNLIRQSISTFHSGNYPYCISTIGLVLEEQLTQIYETLFRVKCPPGLTLGELLDSIDKEVRSRFVVNLKKPAAVAFNIDDIYRRINDALVSDPNTLAKAELLILIRDVLTIIKENNANILAKFKATNKREGPSVFPDLIREGMEELIRYRNAISHRSRTPVGSFEAIKAMFHVSSLIMWWTAEKKSINWKDTADNIIRQMTNKNNANA